MSTITSSGLGSGLPVDTWIESLVAVEQQKITPYTEKLTKLETAKTQIGTVQTKYSSLRSAVEKFTDSNLLSTLDLFSKKTTKSSDEKYATATATNSTPVQQLKLSVSQLATATTATSNKNISQVADDDTKLMSLNNSVVTKGKASVYVDGEKKEFTVTADSTVKDLKDWMDSLTGVAGSTTISADGKFSIDLTGSTVTDMKIGSSDDKSTLWTFLGLDDLHEDPDDPTSKLTGFESTKDLNKINYTGKLVGNETNLTEEVTVGTFKIGTAEFTINKNTTLSDLVYQINTSTKSGVIASYDTINNKLVLTSKNPGETTINVEKGTSNFTDVMGLTDSTGKIASGSQVLGKNAIFELNGKQIESASNTISEAATGVKGLTLNLNKVNDTETPETTINITQNTDDLVTAVNDFITKFNDTISTMKTQTASGGALKSETSLNSMMSSLQNIVMNSVDGLTDYKSLSAIGISTGTPGKKVSDTSTALVLDKDKFLKALTEHPDEVKALFVGDDTKGVTGVMEKLEKTLEDSLDYGSGYFANKKEAYTDLIDTMNKTIDRKNELLESYKTRITKQFNDMDSYIAKLQNQLASYGLS